MFAVPQEVKGFPHPSIKNIFLKEELTSELHSHKTLIVETTQSDPDDNPQAADGHVIEILNELQDMNKQIQQKVGFYDHVEIRID